MTRHLIATLEHGIASHGGTPGGFAAAVQDVPCGKLKVRLLEQRRKLAH